MNRANVTWHLSNDPDNLLSNQLISGITIETFNEKSDGTFKFDSELVISGNVLADSIKDGTGSIIINDLNYGERYSFEVSCRHIVVIVVEL